MFHTFEDSLRVSPSEALLLSDLLSFTYNSWLPNFDWPRSAAPQKDIDLLLLFSVDSHRHYFPFLS